MTGKMASGGGGGFFTLAAAGAACPVGVDARGRDAADEQPRKPNSSDKVAVRKDSTRGRDDTAMRTATLAGRDDASSRNRVGAASPSSSNAQ
jgi:hypothetical protein